MSKNSVQGVWTAIATPFKKNKSIDWDGFKKLLKHQQDGGVTGVVVCGTTGEAPTLTSEEKLKLVSTARESLNSKIRVMAGTGSSNTEESLEMSKKAVTAGADSLLVVTPPYNKPSPNGLKLHFKTISDAVKVPICLYHVPGRTAQTLKPEVIGELCKIENIKIVKEASADMALFSRALQASGKTQFLSGDDPTCLASLAVGSMGVISVASNLFPKEFVAMINAFFSKETELALSIHNSLMPVIDVLSCETNPGPLKAGLEILGICENYLRPPLAPVTEPNYGLIKSVLSATTKKLKSLDL